MDQLEEANVRSQTDDMSLPLQLRESDIDLEGDAPCEDSSLTVRTVTLPSSGRFHLRRSAFVITATLGLTLVLAAAAPRAGLSFWKRSIESSDFLSSEHEEGLNVIRERYKDLLTLPTVSLAHISPQATQVLCVVDVAQSVGRIMSVGNSIKTTVDKCDYDKIKKDKGKVSNKDRRGCGGAILGILLNMQLGMGAIASSVSSCAGSLNVPANCAANINGFMGNLEVLFACSLKVGDSCDFAPVKTTARLLQDQVDAAKNKSIDDVMAEAKKWRQLHNQTDEVQAKKWRQLHNQTAHLRVLPAQPNEAVPRDKVYHSISKCVADIDLGTTFVMKIAIIIADSTIHCKESKFMNHPDAQRVCAVDIIGLLGVFSLAVRFFSLAANSCVAIIGESANQDASCSADIAGINAGVFATVAPALNLKAACEDAMKDWDPSKWPAPLHPDNVRNAATGAVFIDSVVADP
eukprot:TRINITY_DN4262_c0_g1_i2.p1 TRINITY_DN4262_c0_g1~~TRINITY_DN4262_c0_g1_i2.p1  ORF type:complete len:478 (+),score=95.03 TRINITY_DN4262_c0_g1_i2:49-1434(+)